MELDKENGKTEYEEKRNQNSLIMAMLHQQNQQQMYMQQQMLAVMKPLAEKKGKLKSYLLLVHNVFT